MISRCPSNQSRLEISKERNLPGDHPHRSLVLQFHPQAYTARRPISKALKTDLINLCRANAIPPVNHEYYENLVTNADWSNNDDDIDPNRDDSSDDLDD